MLSFVKWNIRINPLDFYTKLYGHLKNYGMPIWVMTPARRIVRSLANKILPKYLSKPLPLKRDKEKDVIVSFTSFPSRIVNVWQVVESLKRQTFVPEKIILWLSKNQFPKAEDIPQSLYKEIDDIFEIRLVDGDLRSHKKYYYALREYPQKTIITCDDDIVYDVNMIRRLVEGSRRFPNCIIANHTKQLKFDKGGELLAYMDFIIDVKPYCSENLVQIGCGGVLYPPGCLHEFVIEKELFLKLAPLADDLWLNAMSRLVGTPVVQSSFDLLGLPLPSDAPKLTSVNNGDKSMNDVQINQIRCYFKDNYHKDIYSSDYKVGGLLHS